MYQIVRPQLGQQDVAHAAVTAGVALGFTASAFVVGIIVGANIANRWPGEEACNRCEDWSRGRWDKR